MAANITLFFQSIKERSRTIKEYCKSMFFNLVIIIIFLRSYARENQKGKKVVDEL
jgi:hypothetical protein